MQQLVYQGVFSQGLVIKKFRVKEDDNFPGTHPKFSTALEFIMVHVESSYSHAAFARIFVNHLKTARQVRQERRDICIEMFGDRQPKMLGYALGCLGHVH